MRGERFRFRTLVAVQLLVTLLLLEISLRLLGSHHKGLQAFLYVPSVRTQFDNVSSLEELLDKTRLGFVPFHKYRGFVLNSRSFRTEEYAGEKKPAIYRIMCLGDSFTFSSGGVPYGKMWHQKLEAALNRSGDAEVEVFSLGVPSVGPSFELRLFQLEHHMVRPDLVILAFFVGNDFTDGRKNDLQPWVETGPARLSYIFRLMRNLYRLWEARNLARRHRPDVSEEEILEHGGIDLESVTTQAKGEDQRARSGKPEAWYLKVERRRIQICVRSKRAHFAELAANVGQTLERFAVEVRASGAEFLVMIIPDEFQVNDSLRERVLQMLRIGPEDIDLDLPQRHLRGLLKEREIAYLDLLPTFRDRSRTQSLYWPNDSHWNIEGNRLAGQALANYLGSERWWDPAK